MKRILRLLYVDPESNLSAFSDEHVQAALVELRDRLESELGKTYRWLATCTVAVMAGTWGGERRRKRRIKLLKMANTCRVRLGVEPMVLEGDGWASSNLYYGYGAREQYAQATGISSYTTFLISLADSRGMSVAKSFDEQFGGVR
jgi:hypothetical protein